MLTQLGYWSAAGSLQSLPRETVMLQNVKERYCVRRIGFICLKTGTSGGVP
jgi:hypothetical protein